MRVWEQFQHIVQPPIFRRTRSGGRPCPPASSGFLRTQRNAFLNPFFSFSARKKRTVSICQEKKEGIVPTVVQKFSQKISAFSRPSHPSLPPERSLRSAHRLSETPSCISDFHTQQVPRARPLVARRGVGKPFERFPHALFSFGGSTPFPFLKEKRKWGRKNILRKEAKRMGAQTHTPRIPRASPGTKP